MATVSARKPARKTNKTATPFVLVSLPNLPSVDDVRRALLGLGVSANAHRKTLEAWESMLWADCYGSLTANEMEQRAYEAAAAALHNATQPAPEPTPDPTPVVKARFEPSADDQAWWNQNAPGRNEHYNVIGRRPIRTGSRTPSERYTAETAETMDCVSSFAGHPV